MRTLLSVFPGFVPGGAQMRFVRLANALGRAWRHHVVSLDGRCSARELLDPGLDVAVLPAPASLSAIRALLRTHRPDVMLTHNWGSIDWALANVLRIRPLPHLHAEDGFNPDEATRQLRRRVFARRLLLRRARVVVPSATLRRIARDTWRIPARRLAFVPNGVDLERFAPRPREPDRAVIVGTVAALRPEKNVARLVEAVAHARTRPDLPPLRLLIAGDGPERAPLETLAARLLPPGDCEFVGHLADPAPFYARLDLFALSSDTEQMPLSLLEAMACGLPAAATDVGDVADLLGPEGGDLVVPCDATRLGDAIAMLAADPERARFGRTNRARAVSRHDERMMFKAWSDLLDKPFAPRR